MIADVLQEEKDRISEMLEDISNSIDGLQFLNIPDYEVSKEFKERWELRLEKFFSDIDHYKKNEFPIVVLGRWNSGKSTLINAILGEDILPSANKEMTSILTRVCYGNEQEVIARFKGGEYQAIQPSELEGYLNFRGSKYSEKLERIDIKLDNSLLKSGKRVFR